MPAISPTSVRKDVQHSRDRPTGWIELHLGTRVDIRCQSQDAAAEKAAVTAAFAEVARIHRLMSFHDSDSDVSRLNRGGAAAPVTVDPRTVTVIRAALEISRVSQGHFDISVAPELVKWGCLPRPEFACTPDPDASWQDIEVVAEDAVRFHRPLWIDLGGIAKGYAVDRAFEACSLVAAGDCVVNAGGDIRVSAGITCSVALDVPGAESRTVPTVELSGGSIASSCTVPAGSAPAQPPCHCDGLSRRAPQSRRFVSVLAEDCMRADALTKVVLALGRHSLPALSGCGATALLRDADGGWQELPHAGAIPSAEHRAGTSPGA